MTEILIDKSKTVSDEDIKFFRNALKLKLENSRLPRENLLIYRLITGEIQENGKDEQKT